MLSLFSPPLDIFSIVAGVVLGLSVIEILLFALGASLSKVFAHDISADIDVHHDVHIDFDMNHDINLFHVGQVPFLVILLSLGSSFSLSGFGIHALAEYVDISLSNLLVIPGSIFLSSVFTYGLTSLWTKLFPNDETYVIHSDELLGQTGKVIIGNGNYETSVEVAVKDKHGSTHYVMTKSAIPELSFKQDDTVILVEKYESGEFGAIPAELEVNKKMFKKDVNQIELEINH